MDCDDVRMMQSPKVLLLPSAAIAVGARLELEEES